MKSSDSIRHGLELKSRRQERDPLGLRENIVRADLLDEFRGLCIPHRRGRSHANRRNG